MLLLTKSLSQHFSFFLFLFPLGLINCMYKVFMGMCGGALQRERQSADTLRTFLRETHKHEAWMSIFSTNRPIWKQKKEPPSLLDIYKIDINWRWLHAKWCTLGILGRCYFSKGVCLFHLNLKKILLWLFLIIILIIILIMYYSIASLHTVQIIWNDLKHQVLFCISHTTSCQNIVANISMCIRCRFNECAMVLWP